MDLDINQAIDYQACSLDQLVSLLAFKAHCLSAMRTLVGGAFGREFQKRSMTEPVFQALVRGLSHKNPNVRFQCVQLMDHLGDDRIIEPVRQMLHDWAPRVRKQALHALTCEQCKSVPLCPLPGPVVEDFIDLALHDPNANVRIAAIYALGTLPESPQVRQSLQSILATTIEPKLRQAAQLTQRPHQSPPSFGEGTDEWTAEVTSAIRPMGSLPAGEGGGRGLDSARISV